MGEKPLEEEKTVQENEVLSCVVVQNENDNDDKIIIAADTNPNYYYCYHVWMWRPKYQSRYCNYLLYWKDNSLMAVVDRRCSTRLANK